jgi:phosphoglycolate phosphatase
VTTVRRYDHVVFDLDGTLADTARDLSAAANHVRRQSGLADLPVEQVRDYIGEGARRLLERVLPGFATDDVDRAFESFLRYYEGHLLDCTRLYPGVDELLVRLTGAGVTCSVVSNKPVAFCRALLTGLGVLDRFAAVIGGDSLTARKPDPCGIEHVRAMTGTARERMLLVGDSDIDAKTAIAAGVAFCAVTWGFGAAKFRPLAAPIVIDEPVQLLERVGVEPG